jgi:putative endonuclease
MRDHEYYVYILSNTFHRLYTGVTSNLEGRVKDHKAAIDLKGFTARYGIDRLGYFERFQYINDAIAGEADQGMGESEKACFDRSREPYLERFERGLGKAIEPFEESKMRPPVTFA